MIFLFFPIAQIKAKSFLLGPLEFSKNTCRKWILIDLFVLVIYRTIIGESKNLLGRRKRAFVTMRFFRAVMGGGGGGLGGFGWNGSQRVNKSPTENLEYCPKYLEDILKKSLKLPEIFTLFLHDSWKIFKSPDSQ